MNLVYLASPIYIIGAILLFLVVVGMLYKLFCINLKESFNDAESILGQIDDFDEEAEEEEEEEEDDEEEEDEEEYDEYEDDEEEDDEEEDDEGDEEGVYCTQCGAPFPQGASFCGNCGAER